MTTRGPPRNTRPITPQDPTLASRPVPQHRSFAIQSFGPGAATGILTSARPLRDVDAQADPSTYLQHGPTPYRQDDDATRQLIEQVETWEAVSWRDDEFAARDPTWGYFVLVTDYSTATQQLLGLAMENLTKIVQRSLRPWTLAAYAEEAFNRFRLDVIQDQEALDGASDDRVRAEFRAQIRALRLTDDEEEYGPAVPARNMACLVLDGEAVRMLSDLEFSDDIERDCSVYGGKTIKVLDIGFDRVAPVDSECPGYRGIGDLPITSLGTFYRAVTSAAKGGAMRDLHPIGPDSLSI